MLEQAMAFRVGDHVVHRVYGLGEIIRVDVKVLSGHSGKYYVVQIGDMTLWVPVNETGEHCLRFPTPAKELQKLFGLLASPGESLSTDRYLRKTQLTELMKDGKLESICRVVRDLKHYKRTNKINENDTMILMRARNLLLNEWIVALSVPIQQAERELSKLLDPSVV